MRTAEHSLTRLTLRCRQPSLFVPPPGVSNSGGLNTRAAAKNRPAAAARTDLAIRPHAVHAVQFGRSAAAAATAAAAAAATCRLRVGKQLARLSRCSSTPACPSCSSWRVPACSGVPRSAAGFLAAMAVCTAERVCRQGADQGQDQPEDTQHGVRPAIDTGIDTGTGKHTHTHTHTHTHINTGTHIGSMYPDVLVT